MADVKTAMAPSNFWITHTIAPSDNADELMRREWLLTNGTGAYAAGTVAGVNTRRYHALLVACSHPPVGRVVALTQMIEQVQIGSTLAEFSSCRFPDGVIAPKGMSHLTQFARGLCVTWRYEAEGIAFERTLRLHWKQQAVTLSYRIVTPRPAIVKLSPMVTLRDFHGIRRREGAPRYDVKPNGDTLTVAHDGHAVTLRCRGALVKAAGGAGDWWHNLHYPLDAHRGQEDREDALVPGVFEMAVDGEAELALTAALGERAVEPMLNDDARANHLSRTAAQIGPVQAIAADDFVVDRTIKNKPLSTIMAGYPWFSDWGRDTFIALPGLLLTTQRYDEARAVLLAFAEAIRGGLIPNRFDDYDDTAAHYNTVDASLWYIHAALEYINTSGDYKAWDSWLGAACKQVIDAYLRGTEYGIRCGGDGLISAGGPDTQLTWMDAACGGVVFTPRHGKAVEINALWHSALVGMAERFTDSDKATAAHYEKLAGRVKRAFLKVFWHHENRLIDHVWIDEQGRAHADESIRPNQIFAASLPRSPLPLAKQKQVVACVKQHLLTPFGLRTLPPEDPHYHAAYAGPQMQRDEAYHQGTIWPWLIGPYAEAVLRVGKFSPAAKTEARTAIQPLLDMMDGSAESAFPGVGQLYEIHEARPPHRPEGCFAQAWSVAEVVRVLAML
jgi:predicted glycogen debranching enzyme